MLLKMPQVAARLSISEQSVNALAREGRLPTVNIGRSVFVKASDLVIFVEGL